ncbi:hypothetical protein AMAG_18881 [Allomyces macrogynus ATCC 38327]|uniref:Cytochrome b mRNA-processing protein 4 n=1 Tax=Allomyces macrogynus (strain ATCC 38327) TaxID=578462 RepID=A0A0L0SJJ9_ALLM3|nr:hypothetical protein AMAG_18881 [Allomyces macrogynus ATCC 38327]|eukprot:KNE62555.1 hypothetical protein AMAG_18881 [Allomyces macrogynus ATCC 38327]
MSGPSKLVKSLVWSTGIIGLGVLLMKYTVPTESQLRDSMSPELKRAAQNAERDGSANADANARILEIIKENAKSDRPVWDVRGFEKLDKKQS